MASVGLIVIGTGSAAQTVAYTCREAGWTVAVIDSRPFGGTCQLRGCDPKKVLVGVSELVDWSHRMQAQGVSGDKAINWPDLIRFKRTFTDPPPRRTSGAFRRPASSPRAAVPVSSIERPSRSGARRW